MRIDLLKPLPSPLLFTPAFTRVWTVDQLLDVTVIGKISENLFILEIDHSMVRTHTAEPLQVGSQFTVKVTSLGSQPTLTRIDTESSSPTVSSAAALSQVLPRQQPLTSSLEMINRAVADLSSTSRIPEPALVPLIEVVRQFLAASVSGQALSDPHQLASYLERCGIHLEARLKTAADAPESPLPTTDLKWRALELLGKLQSILQPVPPSEFRQRADLTPALRQTRTSASPSEHGPEMECSSDSDLVAPIVRQLSEQLESIVARITTRQLQTIEAAAAGTVYGSFELPIEIGGHHCAIAIELEQRATASAAAADAATEVVIRIPLSAVTELRAKLRLCGGDLSAVVWSNDVAVRDVLITEKERLSVSLAACGFKVGVQIAEVGIPNITRHLNDRLLSTIV